MKLARQGLISALFYCLVSVQSFALAPVVDDSENFAILDEQQTDSNQSVARNDYDVNSFENGASDEEKPLAHDEPSRASHTSQGQNQSELLDKIQGMQQDIQELRGQLETQAHDLKLLKDQQLAYYKDLDTRLTQGAATQAPPSPVSKSPNLAPTAPLSLDQIPQKKTIAPQAQNEVSSINTNSTTKPAALSIPTSSSSNSHNQADEQLSYMAAYELIKNKQFDKAIESMQAFVNQYPNGGYTANAQYWLGELYMAKANYSDAIQHFDLVLTQYPSSSKAPASLLKIGYALAASGKEAEARQKLNQVMKNYPDSPTASLAQNKLKSLKAS